MNTHRPLRILQILRAPTGGLWRHTVDLSRELARRGHQVGLVMDSRFSDAQTESRLAEIDSSLTLGLHKMPIARMPGPRDVFTAWHIRKLAADLEADIVHGHGAKGGLFARLGRAGKKRPSAFYTPHGGVLNFEPTSLAGLFYRRVESILGGATDGILFESAFARDAYASQIGRPRCPCHVVYNGLHPGEFTAVEAAPDAADFVFVGELRPIKGLDHLLRALAPLRRPDGVAATIEIAGDGPDREPLKALAQKLDLDGRAKFRGVQPARHMFSRGRCVVMPSLAESLPYIALEAIAANKPLIATDVGGVNEIFGPDAGSLLPAADADALQQAMQAFLDAPGQAQQAALARKTYVETHFSVDRMTGAVEAAYQAAIKAT